MARRSRRKGLRIRFKRKFPFITLGGAPKNCRAQLKRVEHHLENAINQADNRGYTAMQSGRGSAFDDPRVKALMRKRDTLLKSCTHVAVKRKGKWAWAYK